MIRNWLTHGHQSFHVSRLRVTAKTDAVLL